VLLDFDLTASEVAALFVRAWFSGDARFDRTRFDRTQFSGDPRFNGAQFSRAACSAGRW
jgi:hypothetical protein